MFRPNPLQIDCVKGLRLGDQKALDVGELAALLAHPEMETKGYPQSDIQQALDRLVEVGWVKPIWNRDGKAMYCLHGRGLNYARGRGYRVIALERQ